MSITVTQVCVFMQELGGVERAVHDLAQAIRTECGVNILCTRRGQTETVTTDGITITRAGSRLQVSGRPLSIDFLRFLNECRADVVHYHLPFPLATFGQLITPPKARKIVVTWHHDINRYPAFNAMYSPLLGRFLDAVDGIVVGAPPMVQSNAELVKRQAKCTVIPFGVKAPEAPSKGKIDELRAKYGTPLLLFVGRLVYYKGVDILLEAIKGLPVSLCVVGDGPLMPTLRAQAQTLPSASRVHFLGRITDNEVAELYHACDAFVLPSTVQTECFGLVQAEAMLAGKPVINTDLPTGVPWVSKNGESGITVPPGNSAALGAAIEALMNDDSLRARLGAGGKQRAEAEYTLDAYGRRTVELYKRLLG